MKDFQNISIKTVVISLILICVNIPKVSACDLCGCTTNSGSSAFGDLSMSNFIGLRYIYQRFESRDGIFSDSPKSEERFNTYQLWGRVPINDSFFMSAVVPYQDLTRQFNERSEHLNGLGDINIIGWYQFKFYKQQTEEEVHFNTEKERSNHTLNIGLGVKLPTGEFEEQLTDKVNPGFQLGTGSLDVFSSLLYGYSANNIGVVATLAYYIKNENKNQYQFGNQFSYASNVFYKMTFNTATLKPFLGVSGDHYGAIRQYGETLQDTDGSIFNGSLGSEYTRGKFLVGAKYTLPLAQNLFGGNVESQNQFSVYLNYSL